MARRTDFLWRTSRSLEQTRSWALTSLVPVLLDWGFRVDRQSSDAILLVRRRSPWRLAFVSWLAFLLGPRDNEDIVVTFGSPAPGISQMRVVGDVPGRITDVLRALPQAGN